MRRLLPFVALSASLACAGAAEEPIVRKVRAEVAFSIATGQEGVQYGLSRVQRDGKEFPPAPNMKLDPSTGAFSWLPTESQAGAYEVTFLVKAADGKIEHRLRSVTVEAGEIVPPADRSPIAELLRKWYKEGTAAGNTGDFYDNRDGGHSQLATARYPQLDKVEYTEEMRQRRLHWAVQLNLLFSRVTFGNSSTASGDPVWGSNSRHIQLSARAMEALYQQYTHNHLYIYPEHRDHDPGHNGRGAGYGDLFPANTPYVITSQGSSGSDQPFMQAMPYTLAAFRPEVKQLLVETGLLMPTVQMIFRSSNKNLEKPEDYLTGKAHPSVFEGQNVDALKMVQMAHEMRRDAVPPMVQLQVTEEDKAVVGRDYFDAGDREKLFDTPCAIARILRSTRPVHRMVVSAAASYDLNKRPLTFHWVVLRGDPERVTIRPLNKDKSAVELLLPYQERRPVVPGSPMESCRVDIGAFVHNGAYYSAPGFVCLCSLDSEARTYSPDGRILDVGYNYGDSTIGYGDSGYGIKDWPALLAVVCDQKGGLPAELLRQRFTADELAELAKAAKELAAAMALEAEPGKVNSEAESVRDKLRVAVNDTKKALDEAKKANEQPTEATKAAVAQAEAKLKALQDDLKKADERLAETRKKLEEVEKPNRDLLTKNRAALGGSVKARLGRELSAIKNDLNLYFANAKAIADRLEGPEAAGRKNTFVHVRTGLVKEGILKADGGGFALSPILDGPQPPAERLTKYERNRVEWLNIAILQNALYPNILSVEFTRNFDSPLIATPKTWRDVYRYDGKGRLIGWTRYDGNGQSDFTADGALILKRDGRGRALEARTVAYSIEMRGNRPFDLKQNPGDTTLYYAYDSDEDLVGHVDRREKAAP